MKTIFCILAYAIAANAATFTVKAGGGGNYTTMQACANAMSNGDTCVVYAGTYNEHVSLPAGAIGAYKTLQVNGTDLVYVYDFTINSHNKIIGFHIQNPSSPSSNDCIGIWNGATDIYITSNNFYACGYHAMISGRNAADMSTYVYIQGNTLSYPNSTTSAPNVGKGMNINGDYHLIENNNISHVSDAILIGGSYNVLRGNTMHDTTTSDCGPASSNCHIDFISISTTVPSHYNVFERNTISRNLGSNAHAYLLQAPVCAGECYGVIIRFNVGAHFGSGGLVNDNGGNNTAPGYSYIKLYNNTWVDFSMLGGSNSILSFLNGSLYSAVINDLFYFPEPLAYFSPYITDSTTIDTFSASHNLAWCTGTCDLKGRVNTGSSSDAAFATDSPGNQVADPQFVNYAADNFNLSPGSPAIGAGTYLTTVAGKDSGSGTSLVLNDASFFQDGYGIAGVKADCIAVGAITNQACVTAVNYQTNTVSLAGSIRRSSGDPVWLYSDSTGRTALIGSAPNIGATVEQPAAPVPAPTGLTVVVR